MRGDDSKVEETGKRMIELDRVDASRVKERHEVIYRERQSNKQRERGKWKD